MRNSILASCGTSGFLAAMPRWTSTAQRAASTALANSTSVASGLDDAAAMRGDCWIDQRLSVRLEPGKCPFLVDPH
jgi:hypothetical protein